MTNQRPARPLLERWAAVVETIVAKGGPECSNIIKDDDGYPCLPRVIDIPILDSFGKDPQYNDPAVVASYEKWLREDVAVWAENEKGVDLGIPVLGVNMWGWFVDGEINHNQDPTEAHILCAEAVCKVLEANDASP